MLENHDLRVFESSILYPLYDIDGNILRIKVLNVDENQECPTSLFIHSSKLLTVKSKIVYMTDSILNLLSISDKVSEATIAINSTETLNQKVIKHKSISDLLFVINFQPYSL